MTLENINYIAQTIGVVAILGSLIVVIVQMRQANRLASSAALRSQIESLKSISRPMYQAPGMADIFVKAMQGKELSESERLLAMAYVTVAERTWEAMYFEYRQGRIDPELWEAHRRQARALSVAPLNQAVWDLRKSWYVKAYQDFRDVDRAKPTNGVFEDHVAPAQVTPE